ncbi:hypothetical protein [Amycolatopsis sp. RTGN1]|uniref:hypothetical protein n=1 Tax=Amycolatopsis ponsaeliensis TaxID=2992142 RepID=UPI002551A2DF|nr:hypothetical protein [Amycolatopsis sp. RTGN1]
MSDDEIKAVMTCIITMLTHILTRTDPEVGAIFSTVAPLIVALIIGRRKEN